MAEAYTVNGDTAHIDRVEHDVTNAAPTNTGRESASSNTSNDGGIALGFTDVIPNFKPKHKIVDSIFGKIRTWYGLSKLEVVYVVIVLLTLLMAICVTIYRLPSQTGADFTFAIVLLFNEIVCVAYLFNAIFFERPYELGILVVADSVLLLYLILNYAIADKDLFKLVRLISWAIVSPLVIVIGVMLARNYSESRNLIFRTVGANAILQDMCHSLFLFMGLLKADLQISVSMAILILTSGRQLDAEDMVLLPTTFILGFASFISGYFGARLENMKLMYVYAGLWVTMPAYAVYLIVMAIKDLQDTSDDPAMEIAIYAVIFTTTAMCLVNRIALIYGGVRVVLNFNKNLKQRVYGHVGDEDLEGENGRTGSVDPVELQHTSDRQSIVSTG